MYVLDFGANRCMSDRKIENRLRGTLMKGNPKLSLRVASRCGWFCSILLLQASESGSTASMTFLSKDESGDGLIGELQGETSPQMQADAS